MKMNMDSWVDSVLQSKERLAVPLMTHPGIELTGRSIIEAVKQGEFHYGAIKAIHDNYPTAVAVANIMMDLTVEAEAFGCTIQFYEREVPTVTRRIVHDLDSVTALRLPALSIGRLPEYIRATRLAAENLPDRPVFAGCIGPVSLAGRLYDMTEMMTALYAEPETMKILLQKCADFLLSYIQEFKKAGANAIIMAEPAAGLLSADLCDEFSSRYIRDIVTQVQDETFLFVLHNCGNTGHVTRSMVSTGARGLHFGNKIDMPQVLREIPPDVIGMGNLDPVGVFKNSKAREVYTAATALLRATASSGNFIISTGCDTPPGVPRENVDAFFEAVRDFNRKRE